MRNIRLIYCTIFYVLRVKESNEIVILMIRGQLLSQRSSKGHLISQCMNAGFFSKE